jgi:hypothetical protein
MRFYYVTLLSLFLRAPISDTHPALFYLCCTIWQYRNMVFYNTSSNTIHIGLPLVLLGETVNLFKVVLEVIGIHAGGDSCFN